MGVPSAKHCLDAIAQEALIVIDAQQYTSLFANLQMLRVPCNACHGCVLLNPSRSLS